MFRSIVVGTDGSETAGKAVEAAVGLARLSGATLEIVSAYDHPDGVAGSVAAAASINPAP